MPVLPYFSRVCQFATAWKQILLHQLLPESQISLLKQLKHWFLKKKTMNMLDGFQEPVVLGWKAWTKNKSNINHSYNKADKTVRSNIATHPLCQLHCAFYHFFHTNLSIGGHTIKKIATYQVELNMQAIEQCRTVLGYLWSNLEEQHCSVGPNTWSNRLFCLLLCARLVYEK